MVVGRVTIVVDGGDVGGGKALGRSFYRSESAKSTEMDGGGGGSETVYVKDNVAIHPTQYASERISGRLLLVKRDSSLFMVRSLFSLPYVILLSFFHSNSLRVLFLDRCIDYFSYFNVENFLFNF